MGARWVKFTTPQATMKKAASAAKPPTISRRLTEMAKASHTKRPVNPALRFAPVFAMRAIVRAFQPNPW